MTHRFRYYKIMTIDKFMKNHMNYYKIIFEFLYFKCI